MPVPLTSYKTPGVYVQEIRKLPPSIAQVETAIPAFIGYTQKAERDGENLTMMPTRIESALQYTNWFGNAKEEEIVIGLNRDTVQQQDSIVILSKNQVEFKMNYAIQMFFANGGGPCYIVSVGTYADSVTKGKLKDGLDTLFVEDEPTLLVFPDAVDTLGDTYLPLIKDALSHCNDPKINNRFTIVDVKQNANPQENSITPIEDALAFRMLGGEPNEFKYGAAYYPYIKTTLVTNTANDKITIGWHKEDGVFISTDVNALVTAEKKLEDAAKALQVASTNLSLYEDEVKQTIDDIIADDVGFPDDATKVVEILKQLNSILSPTQVTEFTSNAPTPTAVEYQIYAATKIVALTTEQTTKDTAKTTAETERDTAKTTAENNLNTKPIAERTDLSLLTLADIENEQNQIFNNVINAINEKCRLTLPPSSAMAGVYATVDNTRGVFKSPANLGINNLIAPALKLSDRQQDDFNIDSKGGKSINVLRSFRGIGNLVWAARTMDGNSQEWKYISVRRFFNMVEESVKRALFRFVFEPNNPNTWVSVQASIESFLETQWRADALIGNTPEEAFQVSVGNPETFNDALMLDGFMVVQIGMAVVRPAEFIVLQFTHKFDLGTGQ